MLDCESESEKGFPGASASKESACNAGDLGLIPGLERFPGEGKGYPLQYCGQENSMDCIVRGVTESRTRLSYFHFYFPLYVRSPSFTPPTSQFLYVLEHQLISGVSGSF